MHRVEAYGDLLHSVPALTWCPSENALPATENCGGGSHLGSCGVLHNKHDFNDAILVLAQRQVGTPGLEGGLVAPCIICQQPCIEDVCVVVLARLQRDVPSGLHAHPKSVPVEHVDWSSMKA